MQEAQLVLLKGGVLPGACGAQGWQGEPQFPDGTPDSLGKRSPLGGWELGSPLTVPTRRNEGSHLGPFFPQ